jgi:hypothetical protein
MSESASAPAPADAESTTSVDPHVATSDPPKHARQLIYEVTLQLAVREPQADLRRAERLAASMGGWVQSVAGNVIVMRVPARALQQSTQQLESWGRVLDRHYNSTDVTAAYVDLETRIRVLKETQAQLLELLRRANTVEDALAVRKELDALTLELETALGRMRMLSEQIAFSKITLMLEPEQGTMHRVDKEDPFPWVDMLGVEVTRW